MCNYSELSKCHGCQKTTIEVVIQIAISRNYDPRNWIRKVQNHYSVFNLIALPDPKINLFHTFQVIIIDLSRLKFFLSINGAKQEQSRVWRACGLDYRFDTHAFVLREDESENILMEVVQFQPKRYFTPSCLLPRSHHMMLDYPPFKRRSMQALKWCIGQNFTRILFISVPYVTPSHPFLYRPRQAKTSQLHNLLPTSRHRN